MKPTTSARVVVKEASANTEEKKKADVERHQTVALHLKMALATNKTRQPLCLKLEHQSFPEDCLDGDSTHAGRFQHSLRPQS